MLVNNNTRRTENLENVHQSQTNYCHSDPERFYIRTTKSFHGHRGSFSRRDNFFHTHAEEAILTRMPSDNCQKYGSDLHSRVCPGPNPVPQICFLSFTASTVASPPCHHPKV